MRRRKKLKKVLAHVSVGIGLVLIGFLLVPTGICVLMILTVWSISDKIVSWCDKENN